MRLTTAQTDHCHSERARRRPDYLLLGSSLGVFGLYATHWLAAGAVIDVGWLHTLSHSVFELVNTIWWGILAGIAMIGVLGRVPREFVMSALGTRRGIRGVWRAVLAGVLLDLCSHGILMVGAKLYERGASAGQVMAFLVSSPWNSFSLTLILIALVGLPWTLGFILLSMTIALVTGVVFEALTGRGVLPDNPRQADLPSDFRFWHEAKRSLANTRFTPSLFGEILVDGVKESRMVVRWILFGLLLASVLRAVLLPEQFGNFFGPTALGLGRDPRRGDGDRSLFRRLSPHRSRYSHPSTCTREQLRLLDGRCGDRLHRDHGAEGRHGIVEAGALLAPRHLASGDRRGLVDEFVRELSDGAFQRGQQTLKAAVLKCKAPEARRLVEASRREFTEGFSTQDLVRAKDLLSELG